MEKKLKKFKVSFKPMFREMTYEIEAETEEAAMDTAYDQHVENVGRDNAKDFEVSNCYEDGFDRLVLFDVTFCLMDADGNQLKDDDGNTRVFCNHYASYDDLVNNALGDSDIADVVNQSRGWREAKTPFGNPKEYSELIIKIWDYLREMVERGDDDARQLLEKLNLETKQLLEIDIALETKQLLEKSGEDK